MIEILLLNSRTFINEWFHQFQFPVIYQGETRIKDDQRQKLFEAIDWLNTFLEGHEYVAGTQNPSIADISLFNSVANIVVSVESQLNDF